MDSLYEAREQRSTGEHIRALQNARAFAAAMSDTDEEPSAQRDEVRHRVMQVIATVCEAVVYPEKVTVDSRQLRPTDDLVFDLGYGLDSLAYFDLRTSLEKEFVIRLTSGEFHEVRTVADAISLVQTKLTARPAASVPNHFCLP